MRVISCLLVLLVASTASAQRLPERLNGVPRDASAYRDVRASRPDGRIIPVKRLILERDAYRLVRQESVDRRFQGDRGEAHHEGHEPRR